MGSIAFPGFQRRFRCSASAASTCCANTHSCSTCRWASFWRTPPTSPASATGGRFRGPCHATTVSTSGSGRPTCYSPGMLYAYHFIVLLRSLYFNICMRLSTEICLDGGPNYHKWGSWGWVEDRPLLISLLIKLTLNPSWITISISL